MGQAMGNVLQGSIQHKGNVDLLNPQQQQYLSSILGGDTSRLSSQAYSDVLQPYNPQQFQDLFQKSFIDPAQQALQRQIIPGIKEQFMGQDESSSSALNQALSQAATDVSTGLGQQYMNFYNQQQGNKLQGLGLLGSMASQKTFDPMILQRQGILGPLIGAAGTAAGMMI